MTRCPRSTYSCHQQSAQDTGAEEEFGTRAINDHTINTSFGDDTATCACDMLRAYFILGIEGYPKYTSRRYMCPRQDLAKSTSAGPEILAQVEGSLTSSADGLVLHTN